jgi:receptor protein-tyrosine kinase
VGLADPSEAVAGVKPLTNLVLGLLVGTGLGVVVWWLLRRLDKSIRTVDELEAAARAPVIGALPSVASRRSGALDFSAEPDSASAEAARKLRTNVEFMDVDAAPRTLVIASPTSGEGAEEAATSLALALGEANHRVALVDADLRRSALATYLGVSSTDGLSDVLNGTVKIADVELELADRRIILISAGTRRNGSVDDLASPLMTEVLMDLSRRFEYVILLAPAVLTFADAASIAARVDSALLVSRREFGTAATVARAAGVLRGAGARVLGSVLVGVKSPRSSEADKGVATPKADAVVHHDRPGNSEVASRAHGMDDESSTPSDVSQTSHWPPHDERANTPSEQVVAEEQSTVVDERAAVGRIRIGEAAPSAPVQPDPPVSEWVMESGESRDDWSPAESLERYTRSDIDPPTVAIRRDQLAEVRRTVNVDCKSSVKPVHAVGVSNSTISKSRVTSDPAMVSDE